MEEFFFIEVESLDVLVHKGAKKVIRFTRSLGLQLMILEKVQSTFYQTQALFFLSILNNRLDVLINMK